MKCLKDGVSAPSLRRYRRTELETRFKSLTGQGGRSIIYWFVVVLSVIVDQVTKAAAREVLEQTSSVLVPGIINLVHVENTGAAFSFLEGGSAFFVVLAIVLITAITAFIWKTEDLPLYLVVPLGLVAGGGMGNMIDRVIDGSVTDFIAAAFIDFPVFNVADMCVTVGVFLCFFAFLRWDAKNEAVSLDGQSHA